VRADVSGSPRTLIDGALTLTTVKLLAPHLTRENVGEVLAAARRKSKREVEYLVAALRPLPAVPPSIRKLPTNDHHYSPAPDSIGKTSMPPIQAERGLGPECEPAVVKTRGFAHANWRRGDCCCPLGSSSSRPNYYGTFH
jgi:hypothetical protein